jgi:hypothetical protein
MKIETLLESPRYVPLGPLSSPNLLASSSSDWYILRTGHNYRYRYRCGTTAGREAAVDVKLPVSTAVTMFASVTWQSKGIGHAAQ